MAKPQGMTTSRPLSSRHLVFVYPLPSEPKRGRGKCTLSRRLEISHTAPASKPPCAKLHGQQQPAVVSQSSQRGQQRMRQWWPQFPLSCTNSALSSPICQQWQCNCKCLQVPMPHVAGREQWRPFQPAEDECIPL